MFRGSDKSSFKKALPTQNPVRRKQAHDCSNQPPIAKGVSGQVGWGPADVRSDSSHLLCCPAGKDCA